MTNDISSVGVINGRFQGLHLGHMEYLLEAKKRCQFLFIGITNPDPNLTSDSEFDIKRSKSNENPFTYYERLLMINHAMVENNIPVNSYTVVPFPINIPELIKYYVPLDATFFVTIYDEWGEHKMRAIEQLGAKTELMWKRSMSERFTTGKEVRKLIADDGNWKPLVPKSVYHFIKENNLDLRIKNIQNGKF